jgi:hypothetical protein
MHACTGSQGTYSEVLSARLCLSLSTKTRLLQEDVLSAAPFSHPSSESVTSLSTTLSTILSSLPGRNHPTSQMRIPVLTVFNKGNVMPSTKILTFYRKQPFELEAKYAKPEQLPGKMNPWIGRFQSRMSRQTPRMIS